MSIIPNFYIMFYYRADENSKIYLKRYGKSLQLFSVICLIILFIAKNDAFSQIAGSDRTIAILDVSERNAEVTKNVFSLEHICKTIGAPYYTTKDVSVAIGFPIIIVCSDIDGTFKTAETTLLIKYVNDGGILIAPYVFDKNYFSLFGISSCKTVQSHHTLTWTDFTETALRWMDDPLEKTISLGSLNNPVSINSWSYGLTAATALAKYPEDSSVGFSRNTYGKGFAYTVGFSFQAMVFVPQTNTDVEAQRTYASGFEPSSDVVMLFIKGIYAKYIKYASWKHTAPYNNSPIFILTHDVDCKEAMQYMNRFADWEKAYGVHSTYFVTTHYISDNQDGNYYTAYTAQIDSTAKKGYEIGSHSVGHFPDFEDLPLGQLGNTKQNYNPGYWPSTKTVGGSLMGECEVSKKLLETDAHTTVTSFRPGYLYYPKEIGIALDTLGYKQCSINSANDVLTNFPYKLARIRTKSSAMTKVLEMPCSWFTDPNPKEKTDSLIKSLTDVSKKVYANYAPFIVLLHPTTLYKLPVQAELIKSLSKKTEYMSVDEFGTYWANRDAFTYNQTVKNDSLVITIPNASYPFDNRLSIIVNGGQKLKSVAVKKQDGTAISFIKANFEVADIIIYFKEKSIPTAIDINVLSEKKLIMTPYPNPFISQTTISFILPEQSRTKLEIYDMNGRFLTTLLDQTLPAGYHEVVFTPTSSNYRVFFCKLKTDKDAMVKKIIKTY